jgi:AraC-like DNA-binding protein
MAHIVMKHKSTIISALPLVRLNLVFPLVEELERRKMDARQVLSKFDLSRQDVISGDMFVPAPTMYAIVEEFAAFSKDPHFGVRVGEKLDPWSWSPLSSAAELSNTVGEFLLRFLIDAGHHASSVTYTLETTGKRTTFHERRITDGDLLPRHNDGFTVAFLLSMLSQAIGDPWSGDKVIARVCDPNVVPGGYLGIRVATTDTLGPSITFPSRWLVLPMNIEKTWQSLPHKISKSPPPARAIDAFLQVLQRHIHEFDLTSQRVAEICGINKRTLARRLQARDTSIQQELAVMRKARAEQELQKSDRTVAEIAAMVGYADPTVFSRAFKRWTGVSPRQFRKTSQH